MELKLILQIVGVALGLLYLWLEYRADIRLWVVGLIMPLVHGGLYLSSGLYGDFAMQVYYVLAGLYGWIVWRNAPRQKSKTTQIGHTPRGIIWRMVGIFLLVQVAIYLFLLHCTNSRVPFWAATTTAGCIIAMWMLSRQYVE